MGVSLRGESGMFTEVRPTIRGPEFYLAIRFETEADATRALKEFQAAKAAALAADRANLCPEIPKPVVTDDNEADLPPRVPPEAHAGLAELVARFGPGIPPPEYTETDLVGGVVQVIGPPAGRPAEPEPPVVPGEAAEAGAVDAAAVGDRVASLTGGRPDPG